MTRSALRSGVDARLLPGLVHDPTCGAEALLVPVLREHLAATAGADPTLVLAALPQLVEGIDTDPWAAYIASVVLAARPRANDTYAWFLNEPDIELVWQTIAHPSAATTVACVIPITRSDK
jgi:hypothetical protein